MHLLWFLCSVNRSKNSRHFLNQSDAKTKSKRDLITRVFLRLAEECKVECKDFRRFPKMTRTLPKISENGPNNEGTFPVFATV